MLRNIASNAAGLAFQLALNAMDAVLDNAISKMQAIIQQMNDLTANSCQLAKGLLVDTASAFGDSAKAAVSSQLSSDGLSDQFKAMWGNMGGGKAPDVQNKRQGKERHVTITVTLCGVCSRMVALVINSSAPKMSKRTYYVYDRHHHRR